MKLRKDGRVSASYDDYDFDNKRYDGNGKPMVPAALIIRNFATWMGRKTAEAGTGNGSGYRIFINGSKAIKK